jgi:hypothetical protein
MENFLKNVYVIKKRGKLAIFPTAFCGNIKFISGLFIRAGSGEDRS